MSFVDLPLDIHVEIARILDPRLCSNRHSFHSRDEDTFCLYVNGSLQPNRTLARLTLVCKRLLRIYAPFSTWRYLTIKAKSPAQLRGENLDSSAPSLARVLKDRQTGVHARELFIGYHGQMNMGFINAFEHGNLVDLDRFLANTPRLDTIRFMGTTSMSMHEEVIRLPVEFFKSLSSLKSLRYLNMGEFVMPHGVSLSSVTPLPQVQVFRYSPSLQPATFGDILRFAVPNTRILYVNVAEHPRATGYALDGIEVRLPLCPLFPFGFLHRLSIFLTGLFFRILSVKLRHIEREAPVSGFWGTIGRNGSVKKDH
jgi:hypothetical protein